MKLSTPVSMIVLTMTYCEESIERSSLPPSVKRQGEDACTPTAEHGNDTERVSRDLTDP